MLSKKDKKTISTTYWNDNEQFVHPTIEGYKPFGNFHDFDGIERQIQNAVFSGLKECSLMIMTVNEEGNPSIMHLTFNISKKSLVV